ncbi:hypothetical protein Pint_16069 [Pistacia integerrima]|uniref:Uncharacterized protein n=1 Tax=Pistacia integerrima TaxID=434235 RepID=A0ACC0ZD95_9ROSI|nr:hypothetical protein Pint_16069 [Pistacia integerrima]
MANEDLERGKHRTNAYNSASYYVDSNDHQWTSWLIPMFVLANVAVFIVTMYVNNCPKHADGSCVAKFLRRLSFEPLKENPLFGPSSTTLSSTIKDNELFILLPEYKMMIFTKLLAFPLSFMDFLVRHGRLLKMGGLEWTKVVHGHQGWRLITCIWLHAGVIHLLANMLSLVFIGIRLEQQFGFLRVGLIYLLSGFGGSILSSLFIQHNISVGASGALFGLLGAMLSELLTNWSIYTNKAAALLTLVVIIAINLAVGILPHVDNFAHIGGFLSGFFLGFVLLLRPQFGWAERQHLPAHAGVKSRHKVYQYVFWIVALVLLIIGFTVGLVMLFRGENGNDRCRWCHYLSCVPTSKWNCGN